MKAKIPIILAMYIALLLLAACGGVNPNAASNPSPEISISPSPDAAKSYIQISDFEETSGYYISITERGSAQAQVGDMIYCKYNDSFEDKIIILIGEPGAVSDRTYNSMLTFISLIYNDNEVLHFKSGISKIEKISFDKYEIVLDDELDDDDKRYFYEPDKYFFTKLIIYDKQKSRFDDFVAPERPVGNIIGDGEYLKYHGDKVSYDLVKELLLLNPDNTGAFRPMTGTKEKVLMSISIEMTVWKDMSVATSWIADPEIQIQDVIDEYLNAFETYEVKVAENDQEFTIIIKNN